MTLPKMRPGNLTVTTLLAKRRAVMLPYFAAYTTAEIPSTSPWAVQLLMISGKIPLCALLGWVQTSQPPGLISIAILSPPIFNLPIIW
jgi:hypothetical protein